MKKPAEFLLLLCPALLWCLCSLLLGHRFDLPDRLLLAALCTATGAAAMFMNRKLPGAIALVGGLAMLAAMPVEHDLPPAAITLRIADYALPSSVTPEPGPLQAMLAHQEADLLSLKADARQAQAISDSQQAYPYTYHSCSGAGRSLFSRHPLQSVCETHVLGGTQLSGELLAGDTAVGFVVLDFSGVGTEAQARALAQAYLGDRDSAALAIIDTGGTRLPLEWIGFTLGYAKSQAPVPAFTGQLVGDDHDRSNALLYSPQWRCRTFRQSETGLCRLQGTYQIGS